MTDATDRLIPHEHAIVATGLVSTSEAQHLLRRYIAQQRALAAARATAGGARADPTKVRWVDPIGSCWVQIPDDWKDYHKHGDVRVTLRPSGEKIDDVVAVACPSPPREVPEGVMRRALEQIATCVTSPDSPEYLSPDRAKSLARAALASATIAAGKGEP